jgi:hypothetical protein
MPSAGNSKTILNGYKICDMGYYLNLRRGWSFETEKKQDRRGQSEDLTIELGYMSVRYMFSFGC